MPEEINRILTDHCSDYLFAPTEKAEIILIGEGIPKDKISVTGNTVVDAVYQNLEIANQIGNILSALNLQPKRYFLATIHRQENVDDPARFAEILQTLDKLSSIYQLPVIYPIHPRSRKMMTGLDFQPKNIRLIEPVDFFGFLQLEKQARLILTDSGGVQEESCILGTACVTLREKWAQACSLEQFSRKSWNIPKLCFIKALGGKIRSAMEKLEKELWPSSRAVKPRALKAHII
jgi:UDP-N-acetylglucosamine 2-epimerase (non-hydrolysing)